MNIYKAPNLIIGPKLEVYRGGGGAGALNDESIYTHTLSLSLSHTSTHTTHTHTTVTVSGKEGYWDRKRSVFIAD